MRTKPLRILMISHTCQSPTEGQPKPQHIAAMGDIDLRVLIPNRWKHYGRWRNPKLLDAPRFSPIISPVSFPWAGPAQFYLHFYPGLKKILSDFRPDIIDLWEEPWALVSVQACRLRDAILPETKIISETEQNIAKNLPFPFERFRNYTLKRADFAIARSREAADVTRAKGFTKEIQVVPNGVDDKLFTPMDRPACRAKLNLTGFVAGYIGRLVEEKGLLDMIDALPSCPPDINLLFVGDGPMQAPLEQRAHELNVESRVRFLGPSPLEELPTVMNAIDVLVLASRTTASWKEQFGRVIIEAHACSTPVLGSDSGAIPDVVAKGGLIFKERNPESLAEALKTLHANPQSALAYGQAGHQQIQQSCTWRRVAEQMRSIYDHVSELKRT